MVVEKDREAGFRLEEVLIDQRFVVQDLENVVERVQFVMALPVYLKST